VNRVIKEAFVQMHFLQNGIRTNCIGQWQLVEDYTGSFWLCQPEGKLWQEGQVESMRACQMFSLPTPRFCHRSNRELHSLSNVVTAGVAASRRVAS
jgi:hypothetical protein